MLGVEGGDIVLTSPDTSHTLLSLYVILESATNIYVL